MLDKFTKLITEKDSALYVSSDVNRKYISDVEKEYFLNVYFEKADGTYEKRAKLILKLGPFSNKIYRREES